MAVERRLVILRWDDSEVIAVEGEVMV